MTGTERKVFQKYYPPDYDPSKLPKAKGSRNRQFVQRVMAPYNMQCNTCHEYIYKGKKFNMRRETAQGEYYLGLKIFRFYFRCPNCLAEISFKTDLENTDYQQEHGATRLFDAFKYYQEKAKKEEAEEEAEKTDAMKMLEKRTKMSKQEMQAMGELEEIQELNRRNERIDARDYVLDDETKAKLIAEKARQDELELEEEVQRIFKKQRMDGLTINRMEDDEDELSQEGRLGLFDPSPSELEKKITTATLLAGKQEKPVNATMARLKAGLLVKRKRAPDSSSSALPPASASTPTTSVTIASAPVAATACASTSAVPSRSPPPAVPAKKSILSLASYGSDSD